MDLRRVVGFSGCSQMNGNCQLLCNAQKSSTFFLSVLGHMSLPFPPWGTVVGAGNTLFVNTCTIKIILFLLPQLNSAELSLRVEESLLGYYLLHQIVFFGSAFDAASAMKNLVDT